MKYELSFLTIYVCKWNHLRAGKPSQYITSHPGQLSLVIPPWVGKMSSDGYGYR